MSDKNKHKVLDKIVLLELKANKLDTEKMKLAKEITSLKTKLKKDPSKVQKPIKIKKETCEIIDLEPETSQTEDFDEMLVDPLQFCSVEIEDVVKPVVKPSIKSLILGNFKIPKLDHKLFKNEEKLDESLPVLIISTNIFEKENENDDSSTDDPTDDTDADVKPSTDAENYPNLTSKDIESIYNQIRLIKNSTNLIFDDKEMAILTNLSLEDKRASIMANSKASVKNLPIPKVIQKSKDSKENPSLCPTCQRPFADPSNLRRHIRRIHLGEKTVCCPHCPEKFFAKRDLKRHNFIHEGIKPYKCTFCPKSFRKNTELMKHMMGHKEAQLYNCKICNKVFNQKISIDNHNKAKHDTNTTTATTTTTVKSKLKVKNAGRYFLI